MILLKKIIKKILYEKIRHKKPILLKNKLISKNLYKKKMPKFLNKESKIYNILCYFLN